MTVYAEDIEIGQSASYTRTVAERDIQLFGEATGDMNPVHFDGPASLAGQVVPVRILAGHPNSLTGALEASRHADPRERPAA